MLLLDEDFHLNQNPKRLTLPLVLTTVPPRILKKVVLPAPFGPNKPNTSPCLTSKFNSFNALFCFFVLEFEINLC